MSHWPSSAGAYAPFCACCPACHAVGLPLNSNVRPHKMPRIRREFGLLLGFCLSVPISAILAFFLAGAVVFPVIEPYYATRVLISVGLMSMVYGAECVLSWGTIETCGFLSGNCTTHNLYSYAIQIWQVLLILSLASFIILLVLLRKRKAGVTE
jgi:hypothetical protein